MCKTRAELQQDAIAALNTLQSNSSIVDEIRKSGRALNKQAIPEMIEWCRKAGYEVGHTGMLASSMDQQLNGFCSHRTSIA